MRSLLLISILLTGCASKRYLNGDTAPEGVRKKFSSYDAADCRKNRGQWKPMKEKSVFPEGGYCLVKTSDAGKACSSSSECESYCEVSMDSSNASAHCASTIPPRWDRCVPGYYETGKVLGRGECFGDESEIQ